MAEIYRNFLRTNIIFIIGPDFLSYILIRRNRRERKRLTIKKIIFSAEKNDNKRVYRFSTGFPAIPFSLIKKNRLIINTVISAETISI